MPTSPVPTGGSPKLGSPEWESVYRRPRTLHGRSHQSLCPLADTTDDHTLLWLLNHIRVGIPELIVQVRHHRHTRAYAFFVTATYERRVPGPGLSLTLPPSSPPFKVPTTRSSLLFVSGGRQVHHP